LGATLVEGDDAADTVYGGDKTDEDRWNEDEGVSCPGIVGMRPTPDVFKDIE